LNFVEGFLYTKHEFDDSDHFNAVIRAAKAP